MKDRRTALILLVCAILMAVGAYLLISLPPEDHSAIRGEVTMPTQDAPKAPNWVNGSKEVKPDYSSLEAPPKDVTPIVPEEEGKTQTIEIAEDKVVSFTFVESFADFLLHRFQPRGPKGKPDSLASTMALNKYFGRELDGFIVSGDDIRASRKSILDYAFTPTMLRSLYSLYASPLVVHLVDTAANDEREYVVGETKERRTLTGDEIKAMLRLNSRRIERTADLFRTFGTDPSITDKAARYRRSAKAVERANEQLQDAIADGKDTVQASERLKRAILQRESYKAEIITNLKQVCHACSDAELFYLSQWTYRRVQGGSDKTLKTFLEVAAILDDLAIRFQDKAEEFK